MLEGVWRVLGLYGNAQFAPVGDFVDQLRLSQWTDQYCQQYPYGRTHVCPFSFSSLKSIATAFFLAVIERSL
ncbi:hypothetical protein ABH853_13860 [Pseudomonas sp. 13.2]|uniref:Uncharacterized protein n=1 Tax=Pseudomonas sp. 13.2 TaxID=3144665 RepID=A0AAU7BN62_9PSED